MRILVIDDEVRKAQALVAYFREVCLWRAEIAPGPDEALELIRASVSDPYNLIILDIMMAPGTVVPSDLSDGGKGTGLVLLNMITGLIKGEARVLLYTARTDLEYLRTEGRVARYIQKPRNAREVTHEIREIFQIEEA